MSSRRLALLAVLVVVAVATAAWLLRPRHPSSSLPPEAYPRESKVHVSPRSGPDAGGAARPTPEAPRATPADVVPAVAPAPPVARAGLVAVRIGGGWEVDRVDEGSHAWQIGVRPGDRLLEVEGARAVTLDEAELQQMLDGPDGSDVEILIERDHDDPELPAVRARLVLDRVAAAAGG